MGYDETNIGEVMLSKLERYAGLSHNDREAMLNLQFDPEVIAARRNIYREGEALRGPFVIVYGHVCHQKSAASGVRQILSMFRSGDLVGMESLVSSSLNYGIHAMTRTVIGWIPPIEFANLISLSPNIRRALAVAACQDGAISREWFANAVTRSAEARLAHFIAEYYAREELSGVEFPLTSYLPFTQEQLGDSTGLTSVHVNRMLRNLKDRGALASSDGQYIIADRLMLEGIAGFDGEYLRIRLRSEAANPDQ